MSVKTVLAPLVGGPNDEATLTAAIKVGKGLGAHLEACFVRPDPESFAPYLGFESGNLAEIKEDYRRHTQTMGQKAAAKSRRHFTAICKKLGIERAKRPGHLDAMTAQWIEAVGYPTDKIPEAAKFCDLTVFAGLLADYHRLLPNMLECTLLRSGRPILFVPEEVSTFPPERVVIAWDASAQAARTVSAALALIRRAKQIKVLSVRELSKETADPKRLADYLAWRGLRAEASVVPNVMDSIGRALLATAEEVEADLLVMGGYAHSRYEEAVFGGATLHAMRNTRIALFMEH